MSRSRPRLWIWGVALAFDEQVCDWAKEKQLVCGRKMGSSRLWINAVPSSRQVAQWDKRGEGKTKLLSFSVDVSVWFRRFLLFHTAIHLNGFMIEPLQRTSLRTHFDWNFRATPTSRNCTVGAWRNRGRMAASTILVRKLRRVRWTRKRNAVPSRTKWTWSANLLRRGTRPGTWPSTSSGLAMKRASRRPSKTSSSKDW